MYEAALAHALERRGLRVERQKPIRFAYDQLIFEEGFRVDLMVESQVIVETKSLEALAPVHSKKLLTYLKLADVRVGLLINFGAAVLKDGLRRLVYGLPPQASPSLRINQRPRKPPTS